MNVCQFPGCTNKVSKPGHTLCNEHWKQSRSEPDALDVDVPQGMLSSTKIGNHFGISNIRVNLILAELGWIEKYVKGWVPTDRGNALGANVKEMRNGTPFTV